MNVIKAQTENLDTFRRFNQLIEKLPEDKRAQWHVKHLEALTRTSEEIILDMEKEAQE